VTCHDHYLTREWEERCAAQEKAEWIKAHTCPQCGELSRHDLIDGEPCLTCCARGAEVPDV
jgi:hypothetical protein